MKESAFPFAEANDFNGGVVIQNHLGMTLRDYFAAKALAAYISCDYIEYGETYSNAAKTAYKYADAMMKARES